jgi:hypothetical protein
LQHATKKPHETFSLAFILPVHLRGSNDDTP